LAGDGDYHRITFDALLHLYGLRKEQCVEWDEDNPERNLGMHDEDYVHLFPRYASDYMKMNVRTLFFPGQAGKRSYRGPHPRRGKMARKGGAR